MRILLVALLALAACGSTEKKNDDTARAETPPAPKLKHYRAWCKREQKYLGDWDTDRSKAEALRRSHTRPTMFPHHIVRIQIVRR